MIADIDPRYPNELHLHALRCKPGPCLAPTRNSSIFSTSFCTCGLTRKHRARLLEDATIMFCTTEDCPPVVQGGRLRPGYQRVAGCWDTEGTSPILQRLFDIVNKYATRWQFRRDLPLHSREITCLVSRCGRSTARNGSKARRNRVAHLGKRLNILQTEIFVPS